MATLQATLDKEVEANLGMAMIYTLVSVAQEWVNEKVVCWVLGRAEVKCALPPVGFWSCITKARIG